jgi:putative oxidoreductase
MDVGILIIRVFFGLAIASHGAQKLMGWFGGYGIKGTGGFLETLGFRPGAAFAAAAGLSEMGGGLLVTLGLFTPFGAAAILSAMLVAMISVHLKNGFFAMENGIELPFLYAAAALGIAFTRGGAISFDRALGLSFLAEPYLVRGLLLVAVIGAAITLSMRHGSASVPSKS